MLKNTKYATCFSYERLWFVHYIFLIVNLRRLVELYIICHLDFTWYMWDVVYQKLYTKNWTYLVKCCRNIMYTCFDLVSRFRFKICSILMYSLFINCFLVKIIQKYERNDFNKPFNFFCYIFATPQLNLQHGTEIASSTEYKMCENEVLHVDV